MKWLLIINILLFLASNNTYAQNKSYKTMPNWIKNPPKSHTVGQQLLVVHDAGIDLEKLRSNRETILRLHMDKMVENVSGEGFSTIKNNQTEDETEYSAFITIKDYQQMFIADYWDLSPSGRYNYYCLYAVATDMNTTFDNFYITSHYGAHGLWRSAIVPGWGQFYKGSKVKGVAFLGGTVAFVGGIIATENIKQGYYNKIGQTYDVTLIKSYSAKIDNLTTTRNICIGGAIAVYVYNLVDAIVAPGARRVVVKNRVINDFAFTPVVNQDYSGAAISYKF